MTMTTAKKNYLRPIDFKHGHIDTARAGGLRRNWWMSCLRALLITNICARVTMELCCPSLSAVGW